MRNKEVGDFRARCACWTKEVIERVISLSREPVIPGFSLRGILAAILISSACLFIGHFFFAASPLRTPQPATHAKSACQETGERVDGANEDSSAQDNAPLYASVESVLSMLNRKQDILFVDVRNKEAFEKFRIPGSIHVPLHALKTKVFLKASAPVLVSEGYPNLVLEQTCRELRAAGFARLSILDGGLRSWQQKKGPIEGEAFAASEVSRIPPMAFYSEKDSAEWVVVMVSPAAAESSRPLFPGAQSLPWEGNPSKFASALKAIVAGRTQSPLLFLLVCDENGARYESIERAIQPQEIGRVFYLNGGLEAYQSFLEQQALLRQSGKEEVKRCATCS